MTLFNGLYYAQYCAWSCQAPHIHDQHEQVSFPPFNESLMYVLFQSFNAPNSIKWLPSLFLGPWSLIMCNQCLCMNFATSNPLASSLWSYSKMFSQQMFSRNAKVNHKTWHSLTSEVSFDYMYKVYNPPFPILHWGVPSFHLHFFLSLFHLFCFFSYAYSKKSLQLPIW
jgi:hypothetical protein